MHCSKRYFAVKLNLHLPKGERRIVNIHVKVISKTA